MPGTVSCIQLQGITAIKQASSHLPISELCSTGDNFRFREELVGLVRRMLDEV